MLSFITINPNEERTINPIRINSPNIEISFSTAQKMVRQTTEIHTYSSRLELLFSMDVDELLAKKGAFPHCVQCVDRGTK